MYIIHSILFLYILLIKVGSNSKFVNKHWYRNLRSSRSHLKRVASPFFVVFIGNVSLYLFSFSLKSKLFIFTGHFNILNYYNNEIKTF